MQQVMINLLLTGIRKRRLLFNSISLMIVLIVFALDLHAGDDISASSRTYFNGLSTVSSSNASTSSSSSSSNYMNNPYMSARTMMNINSSSPDLVLEPVVDRYIKLLDDSTMSENWYPFTYARHGGNEGHLAIDVLVLLVPQLVALPFVSSIKASMFFPRKTVVKIIAYVSGVPSVKIPKFHALYKNNGERKDNFKEFTHDNLKKHFDNFVKKIKDNYQFSNEINLTLEHYVFFAIQQYLIDIKMGKKDPLFGNEFEKEIVNKIKNNRY